MTFKIIGMDESGKTGDEFLAFCYAEFNENDESKLFINNLMNFGDFLFSKEILNNTPSKKLVQLSHQLLSNDFIKAKFFKMTSRVQNLILKDIFKYQANQLFRIRSDLISLQNNLKSHFETVNNKRVSKLGNLVNLNTLSKIFRKLSHYDKYHRLPDYAMKSYSFLFILNNLCNEYKICEFLKEENIAIIGHQLNNEDKENIKICKKHKIKSINISELKDDFESFFNHLEDSTIDYGSRTRVRIKEILKEKGDILKTFRR